VLTVRKQKLPSPCIEASQFAKDSERTTSVHQDLLKRSAAQKPECTRDKTKVSSDLSTAHLGARNDCSTCVTIFSVPRNKFPETIRLLDILLHTALTSTLPLKPHAQNNISVTLSDTVHKRLLFSWMVLLRTCFYVHIVQKSAK
jgi:hypothetical protein